MESIYFLEDVSRRNYLKILFLTFNRNFYEINIYNEIIIIKSKNLKYKIGYLY